VGYGFATLWTLWNYSRQLKNNFSDYFPTETRWLFILTCGFIFSWSWALFIIVISTVFGGDMALIVGILHNYILFIVMNVLIFYTLIYTHKQVQLTASMHKIKHDNIINEGIIDTVKAGISIHLLYLVPHITIDEFSKRIHLPVKTVSCVINKHLGTKFFEFINSARIEAAKKLLAAPASKTSPS
jgi:AraC-like DNA-binding protein